ncbi:hypothetical protein PTKIN_Ptkin06aG0059000 [Pterospermum kingtungense]
MKLMSLKVKRQELAGYSKEETKYNKEETKAEPGKWKPYNVKRQSCAWLQVDSVLQTKTGHLNEFYNLGKKLGQGQFGTTFLCVEKRTEEEFACKLITKRKLTTLVDVDDVRREFRSCITWQDTGIHVVMELCVGG